MIAVEPLRLATSAMGTRFELALHRDAETTARAQRWGALQPAGEEALYEIEYWHARLSRFAKDSLVSFINRTAFERPVRLDATTFGLFATALDVMRASGNAFDITLGTGSDAIILDQQRRTFAFARAGVTIDLGSIGKGFALDRAAELLRSHGVTSALLHGGTSSVIAIGTPPDAGSWKIALSSYSGGDVVELRDSALGVSAPHGRVSNGHGHIVDPRSGQPVALGLCAAVAGPSAALADAWSTATVVLGERPASLDNEWQTWLYSVAIS